MIIHLNYSIVEFQNNDIAHIIMLCNDFDYFEFIFHTKLFVRKHYFYNKINLFFILFTIYVSTNTWKSSCAPSV